jgi:Uma2 family endonuclease
MTVTTEKLTADEFLALPEVSGERRELIAGEIVVSPRPTRSHAYTAGKLFRVLDDHVQAHGLGIVYLAVDTKFNHLEVRAPDIQFFGNSHSADEIRTRPDLIPDLCVEILSPSNPRTDRVDKFNLFQQRGVAHYWIVDPESHALEAYALEKGRYTSSGRGADAQTLHLPPFPDLPIPLAKLWHP